MASHVLVVSHPKPDEIQLVQDSGEDDESGSNDERLEEKEFLPHPASTDFGAILYKRTFPLRFIPLLASPVIESQTPPPDQA